MIRLIFSSRNCLVHNLPQSLQIYRRGHKRFLFRYGCFATVVIWLLKFLRASSEFAPPISILFGMRIFHLLLTGLIFYIPYVLSFRVMFGGGVARNITDADTTLDSIPSISVMVFHMALLDDYPYEVGELYQNKINIAIV